MLVNRSVAVPMDALRSHLPIGWVLSVSRTNTPAHASGADGVDIFLGLQVDHVNSEIHMHMDHYVETVLNEYKTFVMNKKLCHKMLPVQPNYQASTSYPRGSLRWKARGRIQGRPSTDHSS